VDGREAVQVRQECERWAAQLLSSGDGESQGGAPKRDFGGLRRRMDLDAVGTVGIVDTNRTDSSVQQIYKGLYAGLAKAGAKPKVIVSPPTNWDPATALTVAQNFLTANPNLDVLVCMHDLVANVCRQVMNTMHYKNIPLAGEGGTCQGFANMLTGKQDFTVAQFLYSAGYMSVQQVVQILQGHHAKSTTQVAPMIGITASLIKSWANGTAKIPPGLGLEAAVAKAKKGCK